MRIAPYGTWESPIDAGLVAGTQLALGFPGLVDREVWWSEGRPLEGGRVALMREAAPGRIVEVTPQGFNARTRINEYGGKAWAAEGGVVLAVSFQDQRIWRLDGGPRPISPDTGAVDRYGDLVIDRQGGRVVAVRERLRAGAEAQHAIVAIPLGGGVETVLVEGADFYAAPALSADGQRLAWLAWDHPDMPWDGAALFVALPGQAPVRLAGGAGSAVVQPGWTADGRLVFAWDLEGIWRLWAWDGQGLRLLDPTCAEQAGPLWQLGATWWDATPDGRIVSARVREGFWSLAIDRVPVAAPFVELGEVRCDGRHAVFRAGFADRPPAIVALDLRDRSWRAVRAAGPLDLAPGWIAAARPLTAGEAHGFFYKPTSPEVAAPAGTRPPLIVRSHGGPTAAASPALKLAWQYWTSRGFALVDVNYRGSTGWGRGYREALNGQWGIADVADCVAAVQTLVEAGEVDPDRVVIAGGSAGGFTTLAALTFTRGVFRAGASWYGIGDLEALVRDTHKFESRYLDRLVGPWPEAAATYRARSPIHHVERLTTPVLFLQGEDDKVVPPQQTLAMAAALRAKGVPVEVKLYPGEGHGFRRAETQIDALQAELAFYRRVLDLG